MLSKQVFRLSCACAYVLFLCLPLSPCMFREAACTFVCMHILSVTSMWLHCSAGVGALVMQILNKYMRIFLFAFIYFIKCLYESVVMAASAVLSLHTSAWSYMKQFKILRMFGSRNPKRVCHSWSRRCRRAQWRHSVTRSRTLRLWGFKAGVWGFRVYWQCL